MQKNINTLKSFGNHIFPVGEGQLASGLVGKGRMIEPKEIVKNDKDLLKDLIIEDNKLRSIVSSID